MEISPGPESAFLGGAGSGRRVTFECKPCTLLEPESYVSVSAAEKSIRCRPAMSSRLAGQPVDVLAAATGCSILIRRISGKSGSSVLKAKARRPEASHAELSRGRMRGIATARCAKKALSQVRGYLMAAGNRHERKLMDHDVIFSRGGLKTVV